ncbi:MAG: diguanylate cyclase [Thermoleophilia bacterium]
MTSPGSGGMADLLGAAARIGDGLDVGSVLQEIATATRAVLGAERATCYAVDLRTQTVAAVHTTETDPARRAVLERSVGKGPDRMPIWRMQLQHGSGQLLVIEDVRSDPRLPAALVERLGAGAIIGVRLEHESVRARGAHPLLGTLFCSFADVRRFSDEEREAARGLATMASLALANAHLRIETARSLQRARELEAEQAALRRVATTAADIESGAHGVHAATAREVVSLLGVDAALIVRFDDGHGTVVGACGDHSEIDDRLPTDGPGSLARVRTTGLGHAVADYGALPAGSPIREHALEYGFTASSAAPVHVDGHLWGAVLAATRRPGGIPPDAQERLARFAQLSALAIENVEARARLVEQATHDGLTGLVNHRVFFERLRDACGRAARTGEELSLIVIDLDEFKAVNDRHGHLVGDRTLAEFADRLRPAVRAADTLGRTGGEEFAWLLPGSNHAATCAAAERLRREIAGEPFPVVGRLTMSAGIATLVPGESAADLFGAADAALYRAKELGRDLCVGVGDRARGGRPS